MKAMVPPETPGITLAAPIAIPFRNNIIFFLTEISKLKKIETAGSDLFC